MRVLSLYECVCVWQVNFIGLRGMVVRVNKHRNSTYGVIMRKASAASVAVWDVVRPLLRLFVNMIPGLLLAIQGIFRELYVCAL